MMKAVRASAVGTAKGPRKSSQHGRLIGSEIIRSRTSSQVHIETAAANLGTTPYWLRLRLGVVVGDHVTREQLRALADNDAGASRRAQQLRASTKLGTGGSRISWQRHVAIMRSRDDLSGHRVRRPDPHQPDGVHVAAAEEALQRRICTLWVPTWERGRI
jgi:hypothetical protein